MIESRAYHCPGCGGDDIWGVEISEIYDGVLYWWCRSCLHAYPRDFGPDRRHNALAEELSQERNRHMTEKLRSCPECLAGKHSNCHGRTWFEHEDREVMCPCFGVRHAA